MGQVDKQGWAADHDLPDTWKEIAADYHLQALALVWLTYYRIVPALLAQYQVVLVEEEERVDLGDNFFFNGRADAVLRPHSNSIFGGDDSDGLVVLSAKSVFRWLEQDQRNFAIDAQGYTEPWLLEQWLRRTYPHHQSERVTSIQFAIALKGTSTTNKELGYKFNAGPLTHPWCPVDPTGGEAKPRRRSRAKVQPISEDIDASSDDAPPAVADDPAQWWPAWTSRRPDGTTKTLSKKYRRVRASEYPGGQIAWINYVAQHHPELIDELWKLPPPIQRTAEARERYVQGLYAAHWSADKMLVQIQTTDPTLTKPLSPVMELYGFRRALAPEHSCYMYNSPCMAARTVCYAPGGGKQPDDPLALRDFRGQQVFIPRQPHHPEDMELDD
jgi:hypothetical protein